MKADAIQLSAVEKKGDPAEVAAENVELSAEKETSRIGPPRASNLYGACMRMHVLGVKFKRRQTQWESFTTKITFGIGSAIHYWMQNKPDLFGDRRRGWWLCTACGKVRYFGGPPKRVCEKCGARKEATVYREHPLVLEKPLFVSGHPDMFFEKYQAIFRVVELKSMKGEDFEVLKAPLVQHEWQAETYMWGCSIDATLPVEIDRAVGYIMYVSKKERAKTLPLKQFVYRSNNYTLQAIKDKLQLYKDGIEQFPKKLPDFASACKKNNFDNWTVKSCPVKDLCARYKTKT